MKDLRVAAVVMRSRFGEIAANLKNMDQFVDAAAGEGVEVVCFPEMCITGYALRAGIGELAETVPGPGTREVRKMAEGYNINIIAGLVERTEDGNVAVTQVVVTSGGNIDRYRKLHLSSVEQTFFRAGDDIPVFEQDGVTLGIQLCYDAHFPELSTIMALKGMDILFVPHASPPPESPDEKRARWMRYLPARAYDNGVFVVACNQTGDGGAGICFSGAALILDPRGNVIAETPDGEERMITADLNAAALMDIRKSRMGFFLAQRRPELYGALTGEGTEGGY